MKRTSSFGNAGRLLFVVCLWLLSAGSALSQEFSVSSFRILPNDVSAFVNSVRDLNDEACALVKVEASADFAFSTFGHSEAQGRGGRDMALSAEGNQDDNAEASGLGRASRL